MRRKGSQEQTNELEKHLLLLLGVPQKQQTNRVNMYALNPIQNHAGPTLAALVLMSPFEPQLSC